MYKGLVAPSLTKLKYWAKQYGVLDLTSKTPVSVETQFNAGSMSKLVTSMLVLVLVGQGRLDLDEDANQYLVSWKMPVNQCSVEQAVTLRHLLNPQ